MKWSDTHRVVMLPAKPVRKMSLVFDEFWTSQGAQVTIRHVDPAYAATLGIAEGDICASVNGSRPKGEAHALSLLDREPPEGSDGHKCVFKTYGAQRWGKPLMIIGAMLVVTVCMILYEMDLAGGDEKEL